MARYFEFDKLSAPGGKFEIKVTTQSAEQLILNAIDKDFYPYPGESLGWIAFGSGSSINHNTSTFELEVIGGCKLEGSTKINPFENGGWYKIRFDVFFTIGINHRIRVLTTNGIDLFSTALSMGAQSFIFRSQNYPAGIIFFHSDTGGTRSFRLDNVSIEPVVKSNLVDLSKISFGNDSDDDLSVYPGNCTLALKLKDKLNYFTTFRDDGMFLKDKFIDNDSFFQLIKLNISGNKLYFNGKLDAADMQYSEERVVFDFRFLDDLSYLRNERSINNTQTFDYVKLPDYIESRVSGLGVGRDVVFKVRWQARDSTSTQWVNLEDFYINTVALDFRDNPFNSNGDVIKAILNNLGAYGIAAPDYKYYVLPKFDNGEMEIETLYDDEMPELKLFSYQKKEGFNFYEHDGEGNYPDPSTVNFDYDDVYLPFPCSSVDDDGSGYSQSLKLTSDLHLAFSDSGIRYKINSATWSSAASAGTNGFKFFLNQIYTQTKQHLNKGIVVKPTGIEYPYDKFYQILKSRGNPVRLIDTVFRPVNFDLDIDKNQTEITLIPAPSLVY